MKSKGKFVKICPQCGSRKVKIWVSSHAYGATDSCLTCGFRSPSFPEIPYNEAKKLPYEPKKFTPYSEDVKKSTRVSFLLILLFLIALSLLFVWGLYAK